MCKNNECYECNTKKKFKYESECHDNTLIDCRKQNQCNEKCDKCKTISRRFGIDYECSHKIKESRICKKLKRQCKSKTGSSESDDSRCKTKSRSKSKCKHHRDRCEKICDMKIKIIDDPINTRCESVTMIHDTTGLIIPSNLFDNDGSVVNEPILYDFKIKRSLGTVTVITNGITVHRITDSTIIDDDCCFWILDVGGCKSGDISRNLIKACFNKCERTLNLIAQYPIPFEGCGCNDECPNFEGLVVVGRDDFIIFSNDRSEFNGQGICFVTIKNHKAFATTIQLKIANKIINSHTYDLYKISTAFCTKNGVVFVPQFPEQHNGTVFMITYREINKVKCDLQYRDSCKQKCIVIDGCVMTLCKSNECENKIFDIVNGQKKFMVYQGIKAMTSDNCGRIYGVTSWVYPYLALKSENPVYPKGLAPECVQTSDNLSFPAEYDRSLAGFYTKPFIGTLI